MLGLGVSYRLKMPWFKQLVVGDAKAPDLNESPDCRPSRDTQANPEWFCGQTWFVQ